MSGDGLALHLELRCDNPKKDFKYSVVEEGHNVTSHRENTVFDQ